MSKSFENIIAQVEFCGYLMAKILASTEILTHTILTFTSL